MPFCSSPAAGGHTVCCADSLLCMQCTLRCCNIAGCARANPTHRRCGGETLLTDQIFISSLYEEVGTRTPKSVLLAGFGLNRTVLRRRREGERGKNSMT